MPELTKQEELKGLLNEVMSGQIKTALEDQEKRHEERVKAIEAMCAEQKAMIEKLAAQPAQKRSLIVPGGGTTDVIYRGYRLDLQGNSHTKLGRPIMEIMGEEKKERYAKFLLDVLAAKLKNDPEAKAALQEGTASEGGYVVPEEFTNEILAFGRLVSFALSDCRIWPMSSDTRRIPAEDGAVSVDWANEESANSESEPTLTEVELSAKRLGAYGIASNELLMDANVDIVSWLTELFGEAIGQELDNQVLNGTGSPCSGLLGAACGNSVVLATGMVSFSSITADDLSNAISKIPANRTLGARWYLHRTLLHVIRTLKEATTNAYIFAQPGNNVPSTIWEYPYTLSEKALGTTTASQAGKAPLVFGNMRYFAIGRRYQSMTLDMDPYGLFTNYQTRFRIVNRFGMKAGLPNGFVRVVTAGS